MIIITIMLLLLLLLLFKGVEGRLFLYGPSANFTCNSSDTLTTNFMECVKPFDKSKRVGRSRVSTYQ